VTGDLKWKFNILDDYGFYNPIHLGPDGSLYATGSDSHSSGANVTMYAINAAGAMVWKCVVGDATDGAYTSALWAGPDGTLYVSAFADATMHQRYIFAFSTTGDLKWQYPVERYELWSSFAYGPDGTVYFTAANFIYAFSSAGLLRFKYGTPSYYDQYLSELEVSPDGTLYFASTSFIGAIDPSAAALASKTQRI
jgi:hypothetical protein